MSEFIGTDTKETFFPICNNCKHYLGDAKCKAFDIIIDDILEGKNLHSKIIKGQKGDFVFTKK